VITLLKKKVTKNGWLVGVTLFLVSTLAFVQAQKGLEEQLAGVRLGAQFIDYDEQGRLKPDCLLAIYGMPDYIVGGGGTPAQPGLMPSAPAQPGLMPSAPAQPRVGPSALETLRMLEMMGMTNIFEFLSALPVPYIPRRELEFGGWLPGQDAPVPRIGIPPSELYELLRSGSLRIQLGPLGPEGLTIQLGPEGLRIQLRPEGTAMAAGVAPTLVTPTFPRPEELPWVIPPFVQLDTNEFYFVYRRQGAHLNFLMELRKTEDRNELRVVAITVAGRRYDSARTAKGDPFKSIKLGDDLQRVLLRYGQPDEIVYYNPLTLQVVNTPTRNLILRYHRSSNIEFTTLENKVVRIFIFLPKQVNFIH